jgi:hypothetical protein
MAHLLWSGIALGGGTNIPPPGGETVPEAATRRRPAIATAITEQREVVMTTQSTLGPFMTLILTLTARTKYAAAVTNRPPAGIVSSLLFAQLLVELLKRKPAGYSSPRARVFRIGSAQECRASS